MSTLESLKETVKRELPVWLESDPAFREAILALTNHRYSPRAETSDWFHQTLEEMRRERERQDALWRKNDERLEREHLEAERKWEANQAELAALREEQNRKWEEQNRKWDANQAELKALHEESLALGKRLDRSIGSLGARWGLRSEKAFRDALAGILEKTFGVEVLNVCEYDDDGEVFGRPDQIELDVIIRNGLLIMCELTSSIDKAGIYSFERKARFYERRHDRQANRLIVISPMIDSRAIDVAKRLGIETYGEPEEVSNEA
ncbi:PD-(D/E)XK nuclease family protein [Thiorhodovibrio frisius]|uniref:DUF3782 domain-containing protein n=1 Tax=Thiorhodovibrio frisius TaxID=631362 RepID=H8YXI0_9GAMM|nr:DUF3782 domain-containing protein [Thiorhodovibrio frisius]EIC23156.1 hypothetical protein containing a coiled-coil domain [Thiorhodovibrio frisius]WPL22573.1 hypothetical protein Thiofri_02740 [Thiorhodovibrio frisius]